jgi:glycosyltransferase involved in cell wall biosynthesis
LRQELGLQKNIPLIGTIAILRRKKGHHIILDAIPSVLKEIPDAVFVFAGDGPQRDNILNKIKASVLSEKVFMLGLRKDIPEILKSIDVFALPTLQEALGTSFIEAMAMGKPVIGADVGGVSEVIRNGVNGCLIEPDNPHALAEAIIKILKDTEAARLMGMEGRKIVEKDYTVDKMCERMYALYLSLIKDRTR